MLHKGKKTQKNVQSITTGPRVVISSSHGNMLLHPLKAAFDQNKLVRKQLHKSTVTWLQFFQSQMCALVCTKHCENTQSKSTRHFLESKVELVLGMSVSVWLHSNVVMRGEVYIFS